MAAVALPCDTAQAGKYSYAMYVFHYHRPA